MKAVVIYLHDTEDGRIQVSVESLGEPEQSLELANEVLQELMDCPDVQFLRTSIFTRPAERVQ
jgi:hypothetical protein